MLLCPIQVLRWGMPSATYDLIICLLNVINRQIIKGKNMSLEYDSVLPFKYWKASYNIDFYCD